MRTKTLDRYVLEDALNSGNVTYESIREDYSGRSMYGRDCFGIVMQPGQDRHLFAALGFIQGQRELEDEDPDVDLFDLVHDAHFDSMGLDLIVYFPGWSLK